MNEPIMFLKNATLPDWIIALSIFSLLFSLWLLWLLGWAARRAAHSRKIERRLRLSEPASIEERVLSLWLDDRSVTTTVLGTRKPRSVKERLDQLCLDAGWDVPAATVLLGLGGVSLLTVIIVFLLSGSFIPGVCLAAGILMSFWIYLKHCVTRRQTVFETQLVDALDLAARSLRAGHPLLGAFQLISEEIAAPVNTVFLDVCQQQALGLSLEEALQGVAQKHTSEDLKLFATSVIIQMKSGGNLADMMERLATVIRERMRLSRRVRVLTAQTQFSKRVLLALPFFIFIVLNIINPTYISVLFDTAQGRLLLAAGTGLLIAGAWMMNRMAVIRY